MTLRRFCSCRSWGIGWETLERANNPVSSSEGHRSASLVRQEGQAMSSSPILAGIPPHEPLIRRPAKMTPTAMMAMQMAKMRVDAKYCIDFAVSVVSYF